MTPTMTVLAFARSTSGFYFGEMLAGLTNEVARAGGRVVVVQTLDPGDVADAVVRTPAFDLPVAWDAVDGAVAVSLAAGAPYLRRLQEHGVPVVLASSRLEGLAAPVAMADNHGGTVAAVDHLLAHGHTRIGFVGNLVQTDIQERYAAYQDALRAHGLPVDPQLFLEAPDNAETGGRAAADALVALTQRPTAIMVATDRNALGLLEGLHAHGLAVPDDVAVVGFDNIEAGAFTTPTLSSVSQRFDEVGALAGRLVVDAVRGAPHAPEVLTPGRTLVAARQSCGCGAVVPGGTSSGTPLSPAAVEMVTDELAELLQACSATGDVPHLAQADVARIPAVAARLMTATEAPAMQDVLEVVAAVGMLAARPDVMHRVANSIIEHTHRAPWTARHAAGHDPGHAGVTPADVIAALWQLQSESYLGRSKVQERLLTEQFRLAAALLDPTGPDPRELRWLEGTHVRAGVLARWSGDPADGRLTVSGAYDPEGVLPDVVGTSTTVVCFPPAGMITATRPEDREACFVVPVRTREQEWGLLAVIGAVDTTSSRDTYLHWAQLLRAAFEGEELERAVRASEERYASAARAANDGLWEFDLRTLELYASDRCRALMGLPPRGPLVRDDWMLPTHPQDVDRVLGAMAPALARPGEPVELEFRVRTGDGPYRWLLVRALGVGEGGTVHRLVGSLSDIHPRKELEEQLRQGALYDDLTGLPNRRLFLERLAWAVQQSARSPQHGFAVVFMDLDGFKLINDSLGHLMGDRLLTVVGERLRAVVRTVDTAARFGGDEFAVLLTGLPPEDVLMVVERIQEAVATPVRLGDHEVAVSASVGITTSASGYTQPEDVLRDADTAMYHAKAQERGTSAVFDAAMHERATGRLRARSELRTALLQRQFVAHYQPIVSIDDAVVDHFEALVRWQHPQRGLLLPGAFIADMEEHGTIVALGEWLVDEVCRQIAAWRDEHGRTVTVSVNVSHREFWSDGLVPTITAALERHGVAPSSLVLEITESVVMADPDTARAIMRRLRDLGLRLHIDDFGTGQSSLHALRSFPVDALKIDGSFIRELGTVTQTSELVGIIVAMGRTLGLEVVAECVETVDQAERLQGMGCRTAQGWLYAKALPGAEAGALLGATIGPAPVPVG